METTTPPGYTNAPYENSPAERAVKRADLDQLLARRRHTEMAITYHENVGNTAQVAFFLSDLAAIDKRIAALRSQAARARLMEDPTEHSAH